MYSIVGRIDRKVREIKRLADRLPHYTYRTRSCRVCGKPFVPYYKDDPRTCPSCDSLFAQMHVGDAGRRDGETVRALAVRGSPKKEILSASPVAG